MYFASMANTLQMLAEACSSVFTWEVLSLVLLGALIGNIFGLLPGLSGMVAVAILIPVTYGMGFNPAIAFLISILGAGSFGGSVTAVLIAIPGTSTSIMTVVDGYPLARQGRAMEAVTLCAVASALGALFGILIFIFTLPLFEKLFFLFGAPEKFVFILLGISAVAFTAKRGQALKAILGGLLGVLVALMGYSYIAGGLRFTLGLDFMWDGIGSIPFFVGTYAIAEFIDVSSKAFNERRSKAAKPAKLESVDDEDVLIDLDAQGGDINELKLVGKASDQMKAGFMDVIKNWFLFIRACIVGFIIGFIPGIGGSAAQMITYSHAVQTTTDKSRIGKGEIRCVVAPEASKNAKDIGQLLPTFGLGIPGSVEMAILLGAQMIHGVTPGTNMFVTNLDTVWIVIICLAIANIVSALLGIGLGSQLIKWLKMSPVIYMSVIIGFAILGAYVTKFQYTDMILAVACGVVGYVLKRFGISRVTYTVAYILGDMLEQYFWQCNTVSRGDISVYFTHSVATIGIWIVLLITVVLYFKPQRKAKKAQSEAAEK